LKFLCDQCKAKYQIADEKVAGKTVRMKCRKCQHVIEIRSAVTDTSTRTPSSPPPRQSLPPTPAPSAAANLRGGSAAPPPRRDALSSALQRDVLGAGRTPFGAEQTASADEWYVAINGVPVGPIGLSELRRKASSGSVTEASLAWREGLEEWRAVRAIPELAQLLADARAHAPRPGSIRPPPARDAGPSLRPSSPPGGGMHGNVVPFRGSPMVTGGGSVGNAAVATNLSDPFGMQRQDPFAAPAADPFAAPPAADPFAPRPVPTGDPFAVPMAQNLTKPSIDSFAPPRKKPFPWGPVALVAAATILSGAGIFVFAKKPPEPTVVIQTVTGPVQTIYVERTVTEPGPATGPTNGGGGRTGPITAKPTASATNSSGGAISLGDLGPGHGPSGPAGVGAGTGSGAGGSLSSDDVQRTVNTYLAGVKRRCWDNAPPGTSSVNATATISVAADGSVSGVSASGNDSAVAKCIENQIRNWKFPAPGGKTQVNVPFKFVRQ
jgi:predicted Zn finger-like uncharacterized protein